MDYGELIYYNKPTGSAVAQYNGNISQFAYNGQKMDSTFSIADTTHNVVTYTYDNLNRLTKSLSSLTHPKSDETISYDLEGNIKSLSRTGNDVASYTYTYPGQSNQMDSVRNGSYAKHIYQYDANGNTNLDSLLTIHYNLLDLPDTIKNGSTIIATYYYDATGNKLRDVSTSFGSWDYVAGVVYSNERIDFVTTEEGRAFLNVDSTYHYAYDLKDYLGNARASYGLGASYSLLYIQENDYYPFGLSIQYGSNSNNRYLYNGKEKQFDLANKYDYGARFYDPVVGRWMEVDPLAEISRKINPYNYGDNNPIRFIDPDGMAADSVTYTGAAAVSAFEEFRFFNKKSQQDGGLGDKKKNDDNENETLGDMAWQNAPKLKPLEGFWAKLGYALNGRSFNHISYDSDGNPIGYTPLTGSPDLISGPVGEINELTHSVYLARDFEGEVEYVGITNNLARRAAEQLAAKGIQIRSLMENLRPEDARAVEQVLIEIHKLGKNGGTLLNKINSIAESNPKYAQAIQRGYELLQWIGYK